MNMKKVGLTALAASLVSVSANAGSMSVSGGADIALKNESNHNTSNSFLKKPAFITTSRGIITSFKPIT